tara:strand:- start:946 stop:1491 length:546 start_codon:yes stop_codon:yes gene_type:complete
MVMYLIFPLDYIVLAICTIIVIICFWKGIIQSILSLLTWIGSIIITIYFYTDLLAFLDSQLLKINIFKNYEQLTSLISTIISIPFIFFVTLFILKKIRKFISSDFEQNFFGVFLDKFFGFLFGFIFCYIIFTTLIYGTKNFEIINFLYEWSINNSYIIKSLDEYNLSILKLLIGTKEDSIN